MKQVRLLKGMIGLLMVTVILMSGWMVSDIILAANNKGTTSDESLTGAVKQRDGTINAESLGANNEGEATPIFTLETLKSYNGIVNEDVYIAVDGLVYDVTDLGSFEGGQHMGLEAGKDLTEAFANSPHSQGVLDQAPVVGEYVEVWDEAIAMAGGEEAFESEDVTEEDSVGEVSVRESQGTITLRAASPESTVFNKESLSQYDGVSNSKVYIAVSGVVYDVTSIATWVDGEHQGIKAGKDLTEAFAASPHSQSILSQGTVVGTYSKSASGNTVVERTESEEVITAVVAQTAQVVVETVATQSEVFNQDTLMVYNGMANSKVYIAVDGIVYDVSDIGTWVDGEHQGIKAGRDVSVAFAGSPHSQSILDMAIVVGTYVETVIETSVVVPVTPTSNVFTKESLKVYNGISNDKVYIAVNGVVYDVTSIGTWTDGEHKGIMAGEDVTVEFAGSPHSLSILNQAPLVGTYSSNADPLVITVPATETQIWTLALLANYNGQNNSPSYIVVSGTIYDVSHVSAWSNGTHKGISAGKDLTSAFANSPHSQSILNQATVVGVMNEPVQMVDGEVLVIEVPQYNLISDYEEDEDEEDEEHEEEDEHDDDD